MKAGLMTTGATNCAPGGDSAADGHRSQGAATERQSACPENTASEPDVSSKRDPNADPSTDPNFRPNSHPNFHPNSDSWRVELVSRLERYRRRRKPRTPHYPSLLLPFDAPEGWSRPTAPSGLAAARTAQVLTATARAGQDPRFDPNAGPTAVRALGRAELYPVEPRSASQGSREQGSHPYPAPVPEQSARLIEFPRSAAIPVFRPSELADPIFDRPRIVEAPEILPPPPALGGMMIEPAYQEPSDRRAGADFPAASRSASIFRRALAVGVDAAIIAMAVAGSAAIFLRLNPIRGPLPILAGALGAVAVLLFVAYEFLFVVYTGSTPGMRAARLRLAAFDGSPLNRRLRRWRVLASLLSAFTAGLGYLWCVVDQDRLCWHDRITRTHVQSAAPAERQ
jgi:uncharacterized RDD family membrane protein YckC